MDSRVGAAMALMDYVLLAGVVGGSVVVGDGGEVDAEGGGVFVHGRRASKTTMNDNAMAVGQIM